MTSLLVTVVTQFQLLPAISALCIVNFCGAGVCMCSWTPADWGQQPQCHVRHSSFLKSYQCPFVLGTLLSTSPPFPVGLREALLGSPGLHCLDYSTNGFLLSHRYPHDVVNHLSCDEAKNHFGGVVSLIPIVLDGVKEWLSHTEKLPRRMLCNVSGGSAVTEKRAPQDAAARAAISPKIPSVHPEAQTSVSNKDCIQVQGNKHVRKKHETDRENQNGKLKGPWKPPGRHAF